MGWFGCHLWAFALGEQSYGPPNLDDWREPPRRDATKTRLRNLLRKKTGIELVYKYDFGDGWRHRLVLNDIRQAEIGESYPRYIAGENAGPPEDCGGIPGFYHLLEARNDPKHPNHAEAREFLKEWDPEDIDELPIRIALSRIANRRNAARKRLSKVTAKKN
ncbi:plasmid pRiA4b ORF-3 family protein [Gluconacetobacter tumulicola]|uniref:Plasmid pRiA4b ORF-3 family protein n=1 Tax=Gluconacetobacter tumulicola TaxID=1017177 RepID=A0A7W4JD52_9PROT|nr:plasmid pRiA4b ORF-3 family protein [Gluconacetobacter tumulicola]MBB2179056.1 plasmid pRiA4b ORF-3 family protein [Gluconacetobacter tumulicola]